jgi:hypothetical protein
MMRSGLDDTGVLADLDPELDERDNDPDRTNKLSDVSEIV